MSGRLEGLREHAAELVTALTDLRSSLLMAVEGEAAHIVGLYRLEVRRTVTAVTLGVTAGFCACGAVALVVFSIMLAFWDTHRVLAAVLSAVCLSLLTALCGLIVRGCTSSAARHGER